MKQKLVHQHDICVTKVASSNCPPRLLRTICLGEWGSVNAFGIFWIPRLGRSNQMNLIQIFGLALRGFVIFFWVLFFKYSSENDVLFSTFSSLNQKSKLVANFFHLQVFCGHHVPLEEFTASCQLNKTWDCLSVPADARSPNKNCVFCIGAVTFNKCKSSFIFVHAHFCICNMCTNPNKNRGMQRQKKRHIAS